MFERIIRRIILRNGFLDNVYVRSNLKELIKFQRVLRKIFNLPKGVWDYANFGDRIDLWCIDREQKPSYYILYKNEQMTGAG